jgi:hypothetical protein
LKEWISSESFRNSLRIDDRRQRRGLSLGPKLRLSGNADCRSTPNHGAASGLEEQCNRTRHLRVLSLGADCR